jgi:hypothetical protein
LTVPQTHPRELRHRRTERIHRGDRLNINHDRRRNPRTTSLSHGLINHHGNSDFRSSRNNHNHRCRIDNDEFNIDLNFDNHHNGCANHDNDSDINLNFFFFFFFFYDHVDGCARYNNDGAPDHYHDIDGST